MSRMDRRSFLRRATATGGIALAPAFSGLIAWTDGWSRVATRGRGAASGRGGYGPLVRSAECPEFWIPEG
ncbi:MAG: hypothetical protein L0271_24740, partial [Gemmatimonadetes bacterium]|nr:hypothetical protein [Gemmatimonadota bacterium]